MTNTTKPCALCGHRKHSVGGRLQMALNLLECGLITPGQFLGILDSEPAPTAPAPRQSQPKRPPPSSRRGKRPRVASARRGRGTRK